MEWSCAPRLEGWGRDKHSSIQNEHILESGRCRHGSRGALLSFLAAGLPSPLWAAAPVSRPLKSALTVDQACLLRNSTAAALYAEIILYRISRMLLADEHNEHIFLQGVEAVASLLQACLSPAGHSRPALRPWQARPEIRCSTSSTIVQCSTVRKG